MMDASFMIRATAARPPADVLAEPRYVQETFTPWVNPGETPAEVPLPVWNLDGVKWCDMPTPRRWFHRHWAQTAGWAGLMEFKRCPCGATWSIPYGWYEWTR